MTHPTQMRREIAHIPEAVADLLARGGPDVRRAADALRAVDPAFLVSVARGSSDHVATYFKYASELVLGLPVASVGPSVASVYARPLRVAGSACIAISQSGQSPDIVAMARAARDGGALALALTNHPESDLAQVCDHRLNIHAGPEISVAATKTFVTSAVTALWLLAEWADDDALRGAIHGLPEALHRATLTDWGAVAPALGAQGSLFCLGRGPGYAMACEAALKFKETCQIHAESYSSAEVLHGPVSIVGPGFPVIALAAADMAEAGLAQVADDLADKGALVFATTDKVRRATQLPVVRTGHPLTDPLSLIVSFYGMVEAVSVGRGIDPDAPRHLNKVTQTI